MGDVVDNMLCLRFLFAFILLYSCIAPSLCQDDETARREMQDKLMKGYQDANNKDGGGGGGYGGAQGGGDAGTPGYGKPGADGESPGYGANDPGYGGNKAGDDPVSGGYGGGDSDVVQNGYTDELTKSLTEKIDPNVGKPICKAEEVLVHKLPLNVTSTGARTHSVEEKIKEVMKKKKLKLEDWSPDFSECVIYSYELPMGVCGIDYKKVMQIYVKCLDTICLHELLTHGDDYKPLKDGLCVDIVKELTEGPKMMAQLISKKIQEHHCECKPEDEMAERHREVLTHFYERYAPESLSKVDSLMEKYSTKGVAQFGVLMYSLHNKYKKSVKVITLTEDQKKAHSVASEGLQNSIKDKMEGTDFGQDIGGFKLPKKKKEKNGSTKDAKDAKDTKDTKEKKKKKAIPTMDEL